MSSLLDVSPSEPPQPASKRSKVIRNKWNSPDRNAWKKGWSAKKKKSPIRPDAAADLDSYPNVNLVDDFIDTVSFDDLEFHHEDPSLQLGDLILMSPNGDVPSESAPSDNMMDPLSINPEGISLNRSDDPNSVQSNNLASCFLLERRNEPSVNVPLNSAGDRIVENLLREAASELHHKLGEREWKMKHQWIIHWRKLRYRELNGKTQEPYTPPPVTREIRRKKSATEGPNATRKFPELSVFGRKFEVPNPQKLDTPDHVPFYSLEESYPKTTEVSQNDLKHVSGDSPSNKKNSLVLKFVRNNSNGEYTASNREESSIPMNLQPQIVNIPACRNSSQSVESSNLGRQNMQSSAQYEEDTSSQLKSTASVTDPNLGPSDITPKRNTKYFESTPSTSKKSRTKNLTTTKISSRSEESSDDGRQNMQNRAQYESASSQQKSMASASEPKLGPRDITPKSNTNCSKRTPSTKKKSRTKNLTDTQNRSQSSDVGRQNIQNGAQYEDASSQQKSMASASEPKLGPSDITPKSNTNCSKRTPSTKKKSRTKNLTDTQNRSQSSDVGRQNIQNGAQYEDASSQQKSMASGTEPKLGPSDTTPKSNTDYSRRTASTKKKSRTKDLTDTQNRSQLLKSEDVERCVSESQDNPSPSKGTKGSGTKPMLKRLSISDNGNTEGSITPKQRRKKRPSQSESPPQNLTQPVESSRDNSFPIASESIVLNLDSTENILFSQPDDIDQCIPSFKNLATTQPNGNGNTLNLNDANTSRSADPFDPVMHSQGLSQPTGPISLKCSVCSTLEISSSPGEKSCDALNARQCTPNAPPSPPESRTHENINQMSVKFQADEVLASSTHQLICDENAFKLGHTSSTSTHGNHCMNQNLGEAHSILGISCSPEEKSCDTLNGRHCTPNTPTLETRTYQNLDHMSASSSRVTNQAGEGFDSSSHQQERAENPVKLEHASFVSVHENPTMKPQLLMPQNCHTSQSVTGNPNCGKPIFDSSSRQQGLAENAFVLGNTPSVSMHGNPCKKPQLLMCQSCHTNRPITGSPICGTPSLNMCGRPSVPTVCDVCNVASHSVVPQCRSACQYHNFGGFSQSPTCPNQFQLATSSPYNSNAMNFNARSPSQPAYMPCKCPSAFHLSGVCYCSQALSSDNASTFCSDSARNSSFNLIGDGRSYPPPMLFQSSLSDMHHSAGQNCCHTQPPFDSRFSGDSSKSSSIHSTGTSCHHSQLPFASKGNSPDFVKHGASTFSEIDPLPHHRHGNSNSMVSFAAGIGHPNVASYSENPSASGSGMLPVGIAERSLDRMAPYVTLQDHLHHETGASYQDTTQRLIKTPQRNLARNPKYRRLTPSDSPRQPAQPTRLQFDSNQVPNRWAAKPNESVDPIVISSDVDDEAASPTVWQ